MSRKPLAPPKRAARETEAALRKALFLALRRAGRLIRRNFGRSHRVRFKNGSSINLVTDIDRSADRLIGRTLLARFPSHDLLTEESAPTENASAYKWIVDPLDGTTNFAHGFPQVCVSIGLEREGRIVLGGVYDPLRDELFWAQKGRGAWLERGGRRQRIAVSRVSRLARSLLMTGFPYDRRERADLYLSYVKAFMARNQGIRRAGAAALDLCWVACGRIDGYWEWRLKPWDCAAGRVIVEEAGGRLSDYAGKPYSIYGEQTLATNGRIHREMLAVMKRLARGRKPAGQGSKK